MHGQVFQHIRGSYIFQIVGRPVFFIAFKLFSCYVWLHNSNYLESYLALALLLLCFWLIVVGFIVPFEN